MKGNEQLMAAAVIGLIAWGVWRQTQPYSGAVRRAARAGRKHQRQMERVRRKGSRRHARRTRRAARKGSSVWEGEEENGEDTIGPDPVYHGIGEVF
jgi:uncharacterized membrane protein YccC